ncbi:MAG: hypothetical protein HYY17_04065 [Planctomycetes bacterium]|nr:hypothetical protein [Planctomycetota bacterium]
MGQVDLFMGPADEARFLDYALGEQGLVPFPGLRPDATPVPCGRGDLPAASTAEGQNLYLAPLGRLSEVRYRKVPAQSAFTVDLHGPVIRWMRPPPEADGAPQRGWIFLGTDHPRPHDLELAFQKLVAWVRRGFRKLPSDRAYAGPEAWELLVKKSRLTR